MSEPGERVAAVVVAFRSAALLPSSLAGLTGLVAPGQLVVVDHGDDTSAEVAAALGATVLRDPTNPGFGAGQNWGVAHTSAPYVLLLNPDAVIDPVAVAAGADLLDVHPGVAAVQGVIRNRASGEAERSQGTQLKPEHLLGRALGLRRLLRIGLVREVARRIPALADHVVRVPDGPTDVESLAAAALLVRRTAFESVGGFDPGYFLYGEDLDLCRRLREAGWRLVALSSHWAEHASGASSPQWWDRELVWWEGAMRFAARWWSSGAWVAAQVALAIRLVGLVAARPRQAGSLLRRLVLAPHRQRRGRR